MLPILLFLLSANCFIIPALGVTCGENEVKDRCPTNCQSYYCPTASGQNQDCPRPRYCPSPACKCRFNYRYVSKTNKTCIPTVECPPFACPKKNEVYNSCPPYCPSDSCDEASLTNICPIPGKIEKVAECAPNCRCIPGYWREQGNCVPFDECTPVAGLGVLIF